MNSRQRIHAVLNYEDFDRGYYCFPFWSFPETLDHWLTQGFRLNEIAGLGVDPWKWVSKMFLPYPTFEHKVLSEDERTVTYVNPEGFHVREFKKYGKSSMPQFLRFPVETREEFREYAKLRLQPNIEERMGPNWIEVVKSWRIDDQPLWLVADRWGGFFGGLRSFVGPETACRMFYTDPAFVEEILDTLADFLIAMMDRILEHIEVDIFSFWEDMAYKSGPLIGPDLVRKYLLPRYKRVTDYLLGKGVKWVALDSDGDVDLLIPIWLEAGINLIYPFECQCGNDVVALRKKYGRELRMFGGFDKRTLVEGPAAIDRELRRLQPLIEEGGFLACTDHGIPPNVPYSHFMYFMRRLGQAVGKE